MPIAVVDSIHILSEFFDRYQKYMPNFNNQMAQQFNLSKITLDNLVNNLLLAQKAEEMGYFVSDKEVAESIVNAPYFQTNGKFDKDLYNRIVQFNLNTTVPKYELTVKRELLAAKLNSFLRASADVSNKEINEEYINQNEISSIEYIIFSDSNLKKEAKDKVTNSIDDTAAKAFFNKNENRVKLHYEDNIPVIKPRRAGRGHEMPRAAKRWGLPHRKLHPRPD